MTGGLMTGGLITGGLITGGGGLTTRIQTAFCNTLTEN